MVDLLLRLVEKAHNHHLCIPSSKVLKDVSTARFQEEFSHNSDP